MTRKFRRDREREYVPMRCPICGRLHRSFAASCHQRWMQRTEAEQVEKAYDPLDITFGEAMCDAEAFAAEDDDA